MQVQGVFGAAIDTSSSLSLWMFVYFGVFPKQTEKARIEVNDFIDSHRRLPRLVCNVMC